MRVGGLKIASGGVDAAGVPQDDLGPAVLPDATGHGPNDHRQLPLVVELPAGGGAQHRFAGPDHRSGGFEEEQRHLRHLRAALGDVVQVVVADRNDLGRQARGQEPDGRQGMDDARAFVGEEGRGRDLLDIRPLDDAVGDATRTDESGKPQLSLNGVPAGR